MIWKIVGKNNKIGNLVMFNMLISSGGNLRVG